MTDDRRFFDDGDQRANDATELIKVVLAGHEKLSDKLSAMHTDLALVQKDVQRTTHVLFNNNGEESLVATVYALRRTVNHLDSLFAAESRSQKKSSAADLTGKWQFKVVAITGLLALLTTVLTAVLR